MTRPPIEKYEKALKGKWLVGADIMELLAYCKKLEAVVEATRKITECECETNGEEEVQEMCAIHAALSEVNT